MGQQPPFTSGATADATGRAVVSFTPRGNQIVEVSQVAGEMPRGASAIGTIRRNGAVVTPFVPTGFAAGGVPSIWLWPGDTLTVEWTGAPAGAPASVTIFYNLGG